MKTYALLALVIASLLLAACSIPAPPSAPTAEAPAPAPTAVAEVPVADVPEAEEPGTLPDDVVAALDEFLQTQLYSEGADPQTHAPGLVLLVDTPEGRYLNAVGVANLEDGTPMKVDDRLEIGSNSKSFTIVLLLQLQEEGLLTIDDPLSQWLPDWAATIPNGDQMTLRQLAQHTSGIWDYGDPIIGEAANDPAKLEQGYTPEELVHYAVDNGTPDFAPGEEGKWNYSNTGYILLGMIIEKATGQSLGELYKERIFDPLGLPTAALIEGVPEAGEITDGYWWMDDGTINNTTNWNVSQGWAAGGIAMTAEELMTYGKALAAGELFQNPDTLVEMLAFDPNGLGGQAPYGLGLIDFSLIGAPGSWGHEGQTAGFQSLWYTNPETGVTVVGLTNSAAYSAWSFAQVAILLTLDTAAEADMAGPVSLTSNPWQWVSFTNPVEQFDIETPESYLLAFNEDGTVSIVADCNMASGDYTDEDGALTIAIGPMTMAACPEGSRSDQFVQYLGFAARYFFQDGMLYIDLFADGGTMAFAPADAEAMAGAPVEAETEAGGVTYICAAGDDFADCDGGPRVVVGQVDSGNFAFMPALYPDPMALMLDATNVVSGQPEVFVSEAGQILGVFTEPLFPLPGEFRINLPIEPAGGSVDLDNDGIDEAGVQVFALRVASDLFNNGYLQQLEQVTGLASYLTDRITGEVTEGTFLVYAPDDAQGFTAGKGEDGLWFTADDPAVDLPAGYTVVTLAADGSVTLDRSPQVTINTMEQIEQESPDFSDQGILESFNSLIDILKERYGFTELRNLDWEAIRAEYLPAVEEADANNDQAAYYQVLHAIAVSLNDTHVSTTTSNVAASLASIRAFAEQIAGTLGATTVAISDEETGAISDRVIVLTVGEDSPAADAGWVPGTEIVSIDGTPVAERLPQVPLNLGIGTEEVRRATKARSLLAFPLDQTVTVGYRLPDSSEVLTATMTAGEYCTGEVAAGAGSSLPVTYEEVGNYAVVRWSDFVNYIPSKLAVLEEALTIEQGRESGGMILDMRGNTGGWVALYETMASYFFTEDEPMPVHLFDWYGYDASLGEQVRSFAYEWQLSAPRPELAYTGPVVVLIDQVCASACEYFTQHLQLLERATVVGQTPSSGAGGPIEQVTLPGGHKFVFTKGATTFAGTDEPNLEAKGVVPDIRVPVTLETELAKMQGEDPVLDAAVAFLDEQQESMTLTGVTWQWSATLDAAATQTEVENPEAYLLTFNEDGTLNITADCNQVNGAYEQDEYGMLTIALGASTLALCPEGSQSEQFLEYLGQSIAFAFDGENLVIVLDASDGTVGLQFDPVAGAEAEAQSGEAPAAPEGALSVDALRNATYTLELYDEPITLTDGHWEGEPYVEGAASRPMVDTMEDSALFGDLDGDGTEDAVVFLVESGGGSGSFVYVAAQLNRDDQPVDAGTVLIEDRIQVKSAAIEEGQVLVEAIVPGPGDGACCPSHKANKVYELQDDMLAEVTPEGEELVRVSAADLDGTAWTLIELGESQPVLEDAPIAIRFEDGAISGTAGCNNYNSGYTLSEDNPFLITLEPVTATRMACPDPVMEQETAYLSALETVTIWGYRMGDLVLRYTAADGTPGLLIFVPADAEAMAGEAVSPQDGAAAGANADTIEATFVCPDGTSIDAVFDNAAGTVTVALPDGAVTLPRAESASGARYSDGATTFWNKGDEAMVEVNGEIVYQGCVAEN